MLIPLVLSTLLAAGAATIDEADPWLTRAERTGFAETARYDETLDYARRLDEASGWIRTTSFGTSPEGRELILVIASKERAFTPRAAARAGTPVVLIQGGIHAGEIAGKDAGLMLLREMAITRREESLLDRAIVLFLPIYNVDGHERFGPWNRINQKGPDETGWRVTSRNLNLNRDYMKADASETRDWLRLFHEWRPALTIDCHTTDGADFRYDLMYLYDSGPNVPESVASWIDLAMSARILPALEKEGHLAAPYFYPVDPSDPLKGVSGFGVTRPMLSNGYTVLHNRPSVIVEAHSLKDYATRVKATYRMLRALLAEVNRDPEALKDAVHAAEARAALPGRVPLRFGTPSQPRRMVIRGVTYRRESSPISGADTIVYGTEPQDWNVDFPMGSEVTLAVEKPYAYVIPAPWTEVIEVVAAHGLRLDRLRTESTIEVEEYRLTEPVWSQTPFEGRHTVTFESISLGVRPRTYPAGSVIVPMNQPASHAAVHLLEPQGADSFASWGFFNAIFERKEYMEAYAMDRIARGMLATDSDLRIEFERALEDPEFAADPAGRLEFFYERSPYRDQRLGLYPVGRIRGAVAVPTEPWRPAGGR